MTLLAPAEMWITQQQALLPVIIEMEYVSICVLFTQLSFHFPTYRFEFQLQYTCTEHSCPLNQHVMYINGL